MTAISSSIQAITTAMARSCHALDRLSRLLVPEGPQQAEGPLRPEEQTDACNLRPSSERPCPARGRGRLPDCPLCGLDPVDVRVSAFAEQGPPLRLGDFLTGRQAKAGQPPAHPTPGRNTGFLLRLAERHAGRAAAVADDDLARVTAVHLPSGGQLDIHHAGHTTRS